MSMLIVFFLVTYLSYAGRDDEGSGAANPLPKEWTPEHYQIIQIFVNKPPKRKNDWMLYKMSNFGGYRPAEIHESVARDVVDWIKKEGQRLCDEQAGKACATGELVEFMRPLQEPPAAQPPAGPAAGQEGAGAADPQGAGDCSGGCAMPKCMEEKPFRRLTTARTLSCTSAAAGVQAEVYYFADTEEIVTCKNKGAGSCACPSDEDLSIIPGEVSVSEKDCSTLVSGDEDKEESLRKLGWISKEGVKMIAEGKSDKSMKIIFNSNIGKGKQGIDCARFLATEEGQVWLEDFNSKNAEKHTVNAAPKAPPKPFLGKAGKGGQDLMAELKKKLGLTPKASGEPAAEAKPVPNGRGTPPGPPPKGRGTPPGPAPQGRGTPPGPPPKGRGTPPGPPPKGRGTPPGPPPKGRGTPPGPAPQGRGTPPGPPPKGRGTPPGPPPKGPGPGKVAVTQL